MPKATRKDSVPGLFRFFQSAAVLYLASSQGGVRARVLFAQKDGIDCPCRRAAPQRQNGLTGPGLPGGRFVGRSRAAARLAKLVAFEGDEAAAAALKQSTSADLDTLLPEARVFTTHPNLDMRQLRQEWGDAHVAVQRLAEGLIAEDSFLQHASVPRAAANALVKAVAALQAHLLKVRSDLAFAGLEHFEFVTQAQSVEGLATADPQDYEEVQVKLAKSTQVADDLSTDIGERLHALPRHAATLPQVRALRRAFAAINAQLADVNDAAIL